MPTFREYDERFQTDGVPGLFSAGGYKMGWLDYQTMLVEKLNELTAGEIYEDKLPKDIAIEFARDPLNASLFNHASMAHNNHFFYKGLSTLPKKLDEIPTLKANLEASFGSIETLRTTLIETAAAMFGPGFVWLVWTEDAPTSPTAAPRGTGSFKILNTYLAGTPYGEAHRRQNLDMATNDAGTFGAHSAAGRRDAAYGPGSTHVVPVLCVNTWQHVWLYDYGVKGKRRYLSHWWDAIDWEAVKGQVPMNTMDSAAGGFADR